jgi:predicted transcriptional regulator
MERIRQSWSRYRDEIDPQTGLPRRKNARPFVYAVDNELAPCQEAVDRGNDLEPDLPEIEQAAVDYLDTGRAFAGHAATLHEYYDDETYAEDDWAKGKETAPEIASAYEAWDAAAQRLDALLSDQKDALDKQMLELVEQREGKSLRWHANKVVIVAREFSDCVSESDAAASACSEPFDALSTVAADFEDQVQKGPAEAKNVFWMSSYAGSVEEYHTAARELVEALREGKPKQREAALEQVQREHEDLVSDYDNLRFDFP